MLNKAIQSGKEHRKEYRKPKSVDKSCRNHGSCSYCRDNRLHQVTVAVEEAEKEMEESQEIK